MKEKSTNPASPLTTKKRPPVVATEPLVVKCGHTIPFELFAPKSDKFRNERRAKVAGKVCPACRVEAEATQKEKDQEGKKERDAARLAKRHHRRWNLPERLPDGSCFEVAYDASTHTWEGTLTVIGTVFTGQHSAVFKLLRLLDGKYRDALAAIGVDTGKKEG